MSLSPLQIITKGIVHQPHVEMAELGLAFQYHEFADGLSLIGPHGLAVVGVATRTPTSPAQRLRRTMAAARVSIQWFGTRKTLTAEQRAEAAEPFGTDARFLSAGKRLLDISHPAFKAVSAVKNKVVSFWKSMSLPYPEPGIRLIRQDRIDEFTAKMAEFQEELAETVANLDRHYNDLKAMARQRLGSLFNLGDYPETLVGAFSIDADFPSVEPRHNASQTAN